MKMSYTSYINLMPVPKMPKGLVELMEGLTRDVLKSNPTNIYEFCAIHMQKLLEIRDSQTSIKSTKLKQKILKANRIINERAEQRRYNFDKEIQLYYKQDTFPSHANLNNEICTLKVEENISEQENEMKEYLETISEFVDSEIDIKDSLRDLESLKTENDEMFLVELLKREDTLECHKNEYKSDINIGKQVPSFKDNKEVPHFVESENDKINNYLKTNIIDLDSIRGELSNDGECAETKEDMGQEATNKFTKLKIVEFDAVQHEFIFNDIVEKYIASDQVETDGNIDNLQTISDCDEKDKEHSNESYTNIRHTGNILDEDIKVNNDRTENIKSTNNKEMQENIKEVIQLIPVESNNTLNVAERKNNLEDIHTIQNRHDYSIKKTCSNVDVEENDIIKKINFNLLVESPIHGGRDEEIKNNKLMDQQKEKCCKNNTSICNSDYLYENDITQNTVSHILKDESDLKNEENTVLDNSIGHDIVETQDNENYNDSIQTSIDAKSIHVNTHQDNASVKDINQLDKSMININESTSNISANELSVVDIDEDIILVNGASMPTKINRKDDIIDKNRDLNSNEDKDIINENEIKHLKSKVAESKTMDLETAAVTIQKVFRHFLFRSKTSSFDDQIDTELCVHQNEKQENGEYSSSVQSLNKERRVHGISRMDTVLQTVNEEKSLSLSTEDSSTLSSAATIIQAHVRSFLVRNKLKYSKTISTNSLLDSDPSTLLKADDDKVRNKTVLNIHIVPVGGNYMSRDESLITSMDLSLDGSPPSSTNLHPLGYDKTERRKQLKREDAIQSISPPSNNSGKLSEEHDSVQEVVVTEEHVEEVFINEKSNFIQKDSIINTCDVSETDENIINMRPIDSQSIIFSDDSTSISSKSTFIEECNQKENIDRNSAGKESILEISSDESDVVTPCISTDEKYVRDFVSPSHSMKLIHSGEFHDVLLPTKVSRSDTSVVRGE